MKWMHLSDIHINKEFNHVMSDILRDELPQYIRENNLSADYLFVTGDYRDSAYKRNQALQEDMDSAAKNAADYILEIAKCLQVPVGNICLAPGNHDLERGDDDKAVVTQALSSSGSYGYKDGFLEEDRQYLLKRFGFFHKVYSYIHPDDNGWEKNIHCFCVGDGFDLLCLNTSIAVYGEEKEGELVLDTAALKEVLGGPVIHNSGTPLFVLAHHSRRFFKENERKHLKHLFKGRPVYYLCGHSHQLAFQYDDEINTWEIMVGTTKSAKGAAPIFSIGEITNQGNLSDLSFYKYDFEEKGKWIPYQKISNQKFINKLSFISEASEIHTNTDCQLIRLPLLYTQASTPETRKKTIVELAKLKNTVSTIDGSKKYTISMNGLPVNAGIIAGYALNKRQEIKLNYQQGDTIFVNLPQNRCLGFEETVVCDEKTISSSHTVDLCIYIQAKSRNDGMSSYEDCIQGRNPLFIPQNPYSVKLVNTEMYDGNVNLEASASFLVDKIVEYRESIKNQGAFSVNLHLFYNGFLGLAVLLGNQMATTFPIQLYDYEGETQEYRPSFCLEPKMFV